MAKDDFLLTYRYTDSTVRVAVMSGEKPLLDIDICDMLRMSEGRPWSLNNIKFDLIDVVEEENIITVLLENGSIMVMVTVSMTDAGGLDFECEWKNTSGGRLSDVMLGVAVPINSTHDCRLIIPPLNYEYGISSDGKLEGDFIRDGGYVAEEHRFSMPVVCLGHMKHGACNNKALFSQPSRCMLNTSYDNEWSIGVVQNKVGIYMVLLSGGVMYCGNADNLPIGDGIVGDYQRGYFDFEANTSLTKRFSVMCWNEPKGMNDIRGLLEKCYDVYKPKNVIDINYADFLKYKGIALKNRYSEDGGMVGYVKELVTTAHGNDASLMHYGSVKRIWTVENLCAAWCDALNSLHSGMKEGILRAKHCVDYYVSSSKCNRKGLRQLHYDADADIWKYSKDGDTVPSGEFGKMLSCLADIIMLFKEHCLEVPVQWMDVLEDGCDFLKGFRKTTKMGLFPEYWNSDGSVGTNDKSAVGVTCVTALVKAYKITDNHNYMAAAIKAMAKYHEGMVLKHKLLSKKSRVDEGDLKDCDKDAYIGFVVAAMCCYDVTSDEKYIKMASAAADILTLYVNMVNYPVKRETKLGKLDYDMRGLSYTSTVRHCCDAIFPSYEFKCLAEAMSDSFRRAMFEMTVNASTQLVSTGVGEYGSVAVGEQPAELFFSNWSDSGARDEWRGGYSDMNDLQALVWSLRQVLLITNVGKLPVK